MFNIKQKDLTKIAAIEDCGSSITYGELLEFSEKIENLIPSRSLVAVLCKNSIGAMAGYLAFLENKIVPLMLSAKLDFDLYMYLIETYHPAYVWAPSDIQDKVEGFAKIYEAYGYILYKTNYEMHPLFPELALLLTTSGSTGSPKLVRQSYKNILANTESIVEYLHLNDTERPITTLPMNYTYGLSIINSHIYAGARLLLTEKTLMQKEFWEFFKQQEATSFGGVPYTYEILAKLRFFRMDLPSLRYMTQAGGKLIPELHRKFAEYAKETNREFVVMYGQTEATARMAYLPPENSLEKYGSMGIAIPGGKFDLIDTEGEVISESDVIGELVYSGDNVTLGYAESGKDLIKGDERSGVLVTGDMAKRDADGYYYIVGRKKRFLKIFGNRVNLDETERLIRENFPGQDCACGGVDDKMRIYVIEEKVECREEIRKFVSLKTGLNSSAFEICQVPEIPKNESGKVLYTKLEELYG